VLFDEEKRHVEVSSIDKEKELREDVGGDLLEGRGPLLVVGLFTDAVGEVAHKRS
jgi:hypothetical protein